MTAPPPEAIARASFDSPAIELRPMAVPQDQDEAYGHPQNGHGDASGSASQSSLKMYSPSSSDPRPLPELAGMTRRGSSSTHNRNSLAFESQRGHTPSISTLPASGSTTPGGATTPGAGDDSLSDPLFAQSLLPVDGGLHAWLFLAGATVIEVLVYGFSFSIGVLHLHWSQTLFGPHHLSTITLASTLQAGMLYLTLGIVGPAITAWPRYVKHMQVGGIIIASAGLIGTAFVTEPWHLIITIGFLYPCATAAYMPCCIILFEWFHRRRGFAAGIMYAGTGLGGTIFPFIITGLIDRVGYRAAMTSIGISFLVIGLVALIPIKRRIPLPRRSNRARVGWTGFFNRRKHTAGERESRETRESRDTRETTRSRNASETSAEEARGRGDETIRRPKADLTFMKHRQVWIGGAIILVSSAGNFIPTLWLPSFADDLQVTPNGTGLISIMNAASIPGNALTGYLSDRYPIHLVIAFNCIITSLVCFFLWGFGTNAATLVAFVVIFGAVGLSFASLWTRMISLIARDDPTVPAMAFTIFAVGRGIGSVTSGPIADALLQIDLLKGAAGGYGIKNYGILLIYTGASILVAGGMGFAFTDKTREARIP